MVKLLTVCLLFCACSLKAQNPYLTLDYDSLVICDFGNIEETEGNVTKIGDHYYMKYKPAKRVKLSSGQANSFSKQVGQKTSYGQPTAACFMPHFLALYYKNGKGIAYVEICISCNLLDSSHYIKAIDQFPEKADDGTVYYINRGLSKTFRKYLKELLLRYGFSNAPAGDSPND